MSTVCTHLASIRILDAPDPVDGCDTCLATGGTWVHLRMCMTCGEVGCCDDSPGRHARAHAESASHPVVRSVEPRESWSYCFVDEVVFNVAGADVVAEPDQPHTFHNDVDRGRIELYVGDDLAGWIQYSSVGEAITITHTEVLAGNRGLGLGGELVREAVRVFGAAHKSLIPSCDFARSYIAKRPELHDAVTPSMRSRLRAIEADL